MISCINQLKSYQQRNVLTLHYLRYVSWVEVAKIMNLCPRTLYRIRDAALQNLKIPQKK